MKIKKQNYLSLNHSLVCKKFSGDLVFVNYMSVGGRPAAVYKARSPDIAKGHKDYMILMSITDPDTMVQKTYVSGLTTEEIESRKNHKGVLCVECDIVLVSLANHDYLTCECPNQTMMDGGQEGYHRWGGMSMDKIKSVVVDLLSDNVTIKT